MSKASLQGNEALLIERLFTLLPVPIAIIDQRNRVVMANSSFSEAFEGVADVSGLERRGLSLAGYGTFDLEELPMDESLRMLYPVNVMGEGPVRRQMVHLEKMASIGRLVSGVAHELNNPLAGILGYAQLVSSAELDGTSRRMVGVILNQAERASRIVQSFLNLASKADPERVFFDLNAVVSSVVELRAYDQSIENIETRFEEDPNLPLAFGDPGQLEQVILNLVVNAEDAILGARRSAGRIHIRTFVKDGQLSVSVQDNGAGIQNKIIGRIFEPFFTTKDRTQGTGLGLSICSEILRDHGGQLYAWSRHGEGATFTLEMPIPEQGVTPSALPSTAASRAKVSGKNILVVDDEVAIAELVSDVLSSRGASVDACHSGNEALERMRHKEYDLVVCDQRMPGLSGQTVYRMATSRDPEVRSRFLFITGDVVTSRTHKFFARTGVRFLRKPFRMQELLGAVDQLFGATRNRVGT